MRGETERISRFTNDNHLASERKHAISIFQNQEEICYKYLLNEQVSSGENTGGKKGLEFLKGYHQKEIEVDGELCLLWENSNNNIITGNHYYCLTMKTDVDLTKYFSTNIVHIVFP